MPRETVDIEVRGGAAPLWWSFPMLSVSRGAGRAALIKDAALRRQLDGAYRLARWVGVEQLVLLNAYEDGSPVVDLLPSDCRT
jgi:hypothetical protein